MYKRQSLKKSDQKNMKKQRKTFFKNEFSEIKSLLDTNYFINNSNFIELCKNSIKCINNGGKILLYGNGGSAADAQHLAAELVVKYKKKENLYLQLH